MKYLIGPFNKPGGLKHGFPPNQDDIMGDYIKDENFTIFTKFIYTKKGIKFFSSKGETLSHKDFDVLILWRPEYSFIPRKLFKYDIPIISVIWDWNVSNSDYMEWLGYSSTHTFTDIAGVNFFKLRGIPNVSYYPIAGFNPDVHYYKDDIEKDYDVIFIGTLDDELYLERQKIISKIANLPEKYNVGIFNGLFGDDGAEMINRSKICINFTLKGEMNMKAYEIPACHSLMFIEEYNMEIRDYLEDRKECVYYNTNNLENLLQQYLERPEIIENISEAGYRKIRKHTYQNNFRELINGIEKLNLSEKRDYIPRGDNSNRRLTEKLMDFNLYYFTLNDTEKESLNNIGLLYAGQAVKSQILDDYYVALGNFSQAEAKDHDYLIPMINTAILDFYANNPEKCKKKLFKILTYENKTLPKDKYKGYIISINKFYSTQLLQINFFKNSEVLKHKYIMGLANELLGHVFQFEQDFQNAEKHFLKSLEINHDNYNIHIKIGNLYRNFNNFQKAFKHYIEFFKIRPFYIKNYYNIIELKNSIDKKEYSKYEKIMRNILERYFPMDNKILLDKMDELLERM